MRWHDHSDIEGKHSFLSASQSSWLNYTEDQLRINFQSQFAKEKGTEEHELISNLIRFNKKYHSHDKQYLKLQTVKRTPNMYFKDVLEAGMDTEVPLYYSQNAFGTADAISFEDNVLRIYDLKTGKIPAKIRQLKVYAAYFCLEYNIYPESIKIILRIYQDNQIQECEADPEEILHIMDKIIYFDDVIESMK